MTEIETLLAEQARLSEERAIAFRAYEAVKAALADVEKRLKEAMIAEKGWQPGQEIKLTDGREAKISYIRVASDGSLVAACYDRIKTGQWSARSRLTVTLRKGNA